MSTEYIKAPAKKWILMLYLAADNNLSEEGVWTLTEIQDVVQQGNLKKDIGIVVLFDTNVRGRKTQIFEFGFGEPTNLLENQKKFGGRLGAGRDVSDWLENQDPKLNLDDANHPDLLTAFIKHTAEKHQAEHYALILSGHGSGAVGDFLGQGEDNVTGSDYKGMSILTLGEAISNAKVTIDILGMDSCLMSMAEVCFELPSEVQLLVGSEGNGPLTGWPFREILLKLKEWELKEAKSPPPAGGKAGPSAKEFALIIQREYIRYYSDYFVAGTSVDLAVCDLSETKKQHLTDKLKELAIAMMEEIKNDSSVRDKVILAHWRAQSYKNEQYTDLWDFCNLLQVGLNSRQIIDCCEEVKDAIKSLVLESEYYGVRFQHSNGLSVYFPWEYSKELDAYAGVEIEERTILKGLHFAKAALWGDFLKEYVFVTRREMRGVKLEKDKWVLESQDLGKIEVVTSSGNTATVHLLEDREFPPNTKEFPPNTKEFPPNTKEFPPNTKGALARLASMKNPPIGFLRNRETGEAVE